MTSQMVGGQIGADITLRDTTLPTDQAELDEFAYGVSDRFASQGLNLFTDPSGNVPSAAAHRHRRAMSALRRRFKSIPPSSRTRPWCATATSP